MHDDTNAFAANPFARLAPLAGAATYALIGLATAWGPEPGGWLATLTGGGRVHGVSAVAAGTLLLFGAVALCDTDVAAPSSAVLSLVMLGVIALGLTLHVPVAGAAMLFAAATLVAWATRGGRYAL